MKDVELLENVVFTILYQEQVKETQETIVRLGELDVYTIPLKDLSLNRLTRPVCSRYLGSSRSGQQMSPLVPNNVNFFIVYLHSFISGVVILDSWSNKMSAPDTSMRLEITALEKPSQL